MFNKSIYFIRRLNRQNFHFSNWWIISGMEVMKKIYKILAQVMLATPKNTGACCVNTTIVSLTLFIFLPCFI